VYRVGQSRTASGAITDGAFVSEGLPETAWGEGLVDRSLTSLWYAGTWNEVDDDELAFLLPSLSSWRPAASPTPPGAEHRDGPVEYLTQLLLERAHAAAVFMAAKSRRHPASEVPRILTALAGMGVLTMLALPQSWEDAAEYSDLNHAAPAPGPMPDWLAIELTALAHLDRLLHDARGAAGTARPLIDWPLALPDAVLAAVNARLNAAYVYPQFAHAHELLTVAALLGHLVQGRPAYIPAHLAEALAEQLAKDTGPARREDDWCACIIKLYADLAGGAARMLIFAKRAAASGRPHLARPAAPIVPQNIGRSNWNGRLLDRISDRWQVLA
jgi:hypothetical protein